MRSNLPPLQLASLPQRNLELEYSASLDLQPVDVPNQQQQQQLQQSQNWNANIIHPPPSQVNQTTSLYIHPTPYTASYNQYSQQQAYPSPQTPNFPNIQYQQVQDPYSLPYQSNTSYLPPPPQQFVSNQNQSNNFSYHQFDPSSTSTATTNSYYPQLPPIPMSASREWDWEKDQQTYIESQRGIIWNGGKEPSTSSSEASASEFNQSQFEAEASSSYSDEPHLQSEGRNYEGRRSFIENLTYILESTSTSLNEEGEEITQPGLYYGDTVTFDSTGEYILVHSDKGGRLEKEILPYWFKHASTAAFSRQMNLYKFNHLTRAETLQILETSSLVQSTNTSPKNWKAWHHPNFTKAKPNDRISMKPTPSKARREAKGKGALAIDKAKMGKKMNGMKLDVNYDIVESTKEEGEGVGDEFDVAE